MDGIVKTASKIAPPTSSIDEATAHGKVTAERVWDKGVRVFHWALVASVAGALITGFVAPRPWLDLHLIFGTLVAALITYRLVWGFTGSTYARFRSFIVGPWTALRYAINLVRGQAAHHIGHNPLGAVMIASLLLVLLSLIATGLIALGGALKDGPLAPVMTYTVGALATQLHEVLAFVLLGLIALHVLGVIIESLRTHENLARSMVIGTKRMEHNAITYPDRKSWPKLTATIFLTAAIAASAATFTFSMQPARGIAVAPLDQTYIKECGACHTPHHPSLATAATWTRIIADANNHFGDNAELEPVLAQTIQAYLVKNSAENSDSKAAHIMRAPRDTTTLRITDAKDWQRIHAQIPSTTFVAKVVSGKLNCAACHADASTGLFKPRSIAIPMENPK
ncbi:MAG: cytochrome b/b6 domain-containing protein [Hyphomicrobiaceae bacterium]